MGSASDEVIVPWQSTVWGSYAEGSGPAGSGPAAAARILPWNQSVVARRELLPLRRMFAAGALRIESVDGYRHNDWIARVKGQRALRRLYGRYL